MKGETVRLRKQRDQKKGGHQKIIVNTSQLEKKWIQLKLNLQDEEKT